MYVIGGRRSSGITGQVFDLTVPEVDVYNFITGQWSTVPSTSNIPTPRAGAASASIDNEVIVIGGETAQPGANKETEALNITTNTWRRLADLQQARHGTQAIVNNRGIYVAAGAGTQGGSTLLNSQELFNFFTPGQPGGTAVSQSQLTAPAAVDFGSVPVNYDSTKNITITNSGGNQDILVSSIAINGNASFTTNTPFPLPFIIPVGKSVNVSVTFKAASTGPRAAVLVITHSGQFATTNINLSSGEATPVYRINSGGPQLTNSIGTFSADANFTPAPGSTYSTATAIAGTTDDAMYQTERSSATDNGTFGYAFPVSNGQYKVVLHFAEIYHTTFNRRVFDVSIEGTKVLDNYDIFKKAGAFTATTETFTVTVADGNLNIDFSALVSDGGINRPKISAIEILNTGTSTATYYRDADGDGFGDAAVSTTASSAPAGYVSDKTDCNDADATIYPGAPDLCDNKDNNCNGQIDETCSLPPVYRINSGGPQVTNSIGIFAADANFTPAPGSTYTTATAIAGTTDDAMYQTERSSATDNGTFGYSFPVSNGQYKVVLHFAEIFYTTLNRRVFDVSIEGTKVLDNYDIFKKAGAFTATTETFTVTVDDGKLNIDFSALVSDGGINRPKVSAIEILNAGASTATYYRDADGDGFGNAAVSTTASSAPAGYVSDKTDCNDADATIYPGAPDLCDNKDNNCNGQIDETCSLPPVYRINSGGPQVTNSIGIFAADANFTPAPGSTYTTATAIAGTTDDAMYQTERSSATDNGTFGYSFPVSNGQYKVVLHFAEIFYTTLNRRVFDVSIEGTKVLDNYDIFKKAGAFTATTETFTVTVADGNLNIDFSALVSDGGINRPKVSAIEILNTGTSTITYYRDADGDGFGNAAVSTTATIAPAGYVIGSTDCNDADATIYPGAPELCDNKDNNCNGSVDEGVIKTTYYQDLDNDGFGNASVTTTACTAPPGYVTSSTDCNDSDATIYPGAPELCDNKDNNCNGSVDEGITKVTYYQDLDNDGFGNANINITACTSPQGYVTSSTDCNDNDGSIYPGAPELCDNKDNNCNGTVDEGVTKTAYYRDLDNDGFGNPNSTVNACTIPQGYVTDNTDCDDNDATIYPGAMELCDNKDNNCNGSIDENCPVTSNLSINNVSVYESQGAAVLTVTLSRTSTRTVRVNYTSANGTATSSRDYRSVKGTLSIPANTLSATISIPVLTDNLQEPTETFTVKLSNPINAFITQATGTVSILNGVGIVANKAAHSGVENASVFNPALQNFNVKVFPNPSGSYFNVLVESPLLQPVSLKITDVNGRTVQNFEHFSSKESVTVGTNFSPGVYILEAVQGTERVIIKLVKLSK